MRASKSQMANGKSQMQRMPVASGFAICYLPFVISALGQVELRGGEPAPTGDITSVSAAGVTVGGSLVGWDRVKAVRGAKAKDADPWMAMADAAWRARTRLERGDLIAAEPLFEVLFEKSRGEPGPTAGVIAEGLLRCRVRRGAHVGAIDPWLATLESAGDGSVTVLHGAWASEAGLAPVVDAATGLAPSLPPIWLPWPSIEAYARGKPWLGSETAGTPKQLVQRVAELATLYHLASEFEGGRPVQWADVPSNDAAVQLVAQIVEARVGNAEQRAAARKALGERLRAGAQARGRAEDGSTVGAVPTWMEAWIHAAIGRSLVREDAPDQQVAGVLELLLLPARYEEAHPYLSGLALAESSVVMRKLGDTQGADVLAREFAERYPTHPAQDWEPYKSSRPAPTPRTASSVQVH